MRRAFEIVELTAAQRPPKDGADQEHQNYGKRDEEVEDVHEVRAGRLGVGDGRGFSGVPVSRPRMRRNALSTTSSELEAIPIPAIHGVTTPATASGRAATL